MDQSTYEKFINNGQIPPAKSNNKNQNLLRERYVGWSISTKTE